MMYYNDLLMTEIQRESKHVKGYIVVPGLLADTARPLSLQGFRADFEMSCASFLDGLLHIPFGNIALQPLLLLLGPPISGLPLLYPLFSSSRFS
jgi:hypothetical protein